MQKSFVLLSPHAYPGLFCRVVSIIGQLYHAQIRQNGPGQVEKEHALMKSRAITLQVGMLLFCECLFDASFYLSLIQHRPAPWNCSSPSLPFLGTVIRAELPISGKPNLLETSQFKNCTTRSENDVGIKKRILGLQINVDRESPTGLCSATSVERSLWAFPGNSSRFLGTLGVDDAGRATHVDISIAGSIIWGSILSQRPNCSSKTRRIKCPFELLATYLTLSYISSCTLAIFGLTLLFKHRTFGCMLRDIG